MRAGGLGEHVTCEVMMKYTSLSIAEITTGLADVGRDALRTFGPLDEREMNWQPERTRWSVGQCFEHLLTVNGLVLGAAKTALEKPPWSAWQRLPLLPAAWGWLLVRSQSPSSRKRFTAPTRARPAGRVHDDVIRRFVDQHREAQLWAEGLDQETARRTVMISPFVNAVTYSVLDGLRLVVAHDRRHFEQALRVLHSLTFGHTETLSPR
jgi:hypothetical protein